MYRIETTVQDIAIYRQVFVCLSVLVLFALSTSAHALTDAGEEYVDSVYSWGIWELGLEPASGPQAPADNTMNDRSMKLQFRPNDNAAYMTQSISVPPPAAPVPPPVIPAPTIPSVPTRADPGALPGRGTLR